MTDNKSGVKTRLERLPWITILLAEINGTLVFITGWEVMSVMFTPPNLHFPTPQGATIAVFSAVLFLLLVGYVYFEASVMGDIEKAITNRGNHIE